MDEPQNAKPWTRPISTPIKLSVPGPQFIVFLEEYAGRIESLCADAVRYEWGAERFGRLCEVSIINSRQILQCNISSLVRMFLHTVNTDQEYQSASIRLASRNLKDRIEWFGGACSG